ncbi:MAG: colanic acid exporter [bacterium ADurb.Bin478]|nr:MAG: colanic acid exporter [bacterium ADurb.Bin478]
MSVDVLSSLDTLVIPKILDYASLGLYAAVLVPAQLFNILARAAKYVWVPEFGRNERTRFRLLTVGVTLTAVLLALFLAVSAEPLLHLLYKGKYDAGAPLLKILAVAGVFRLMYSLSSSLIVGRLGSKALVAHLRYTIFSMILYFFLLTGLLATQGVVGAAWALLIITVIRAALSYWVVMRFRHERG